MMQDPWNSLPIRPESRNFRTRYRDRRNGRFVSNARAMQARATIPEWVWSDWMFYCIGESLSAHNRLVAEMFGATV